MVSMKTTVVTTAAAAATAAAPPNTTTMRTGSRKRRSGAAGKATSSTITMRVQSSAALTLLLTALMQLLSTPSEAFLTPATPQRGAPFLTTWSKTPQSAATRKTALSVWWFGGTATEAETTMSGGGSGEDYCELVAVRIERTSANSRRIRGEITVPVPMKDVWAILTDYDRLSVHVPNLMESKIVQKPGSRSSSRQGDGSYSCRLYQRGAQKIVGFEFGASVTMNMQERVLGEMERKIGFKCHDSFFFQEFDGEWLVKEGVNSETGDVESTLSYVVDVRPKGPVPVAALEWRIREDVPTNLRAVKRAATTVGHKGVMGARQMSLPPSSKNTGAAPYTPGGKPPSGRTSTATAAERRSGTSRTASSLGGGRVAAAVTTTAAVASVPAAPSSKRSSSKRLLAGSIRNNVQWDADETMAAYLKED